MSPNIVGTRRELAVLETDRGGPITAPPRLEERERPVGGLEAFNHLERRRGRANSRRTIASRGLHSQKKPIGFWS